MSKEEIEDIRKRVIRLVEQFDYALTVEQLHKLIKRQIPKVADVDIIEVIHDVANNGDLPPGKYIRLPNSIIKETMHRVRSGPVVEDGPIPSFELTTASTDTDWEHLSMSDNSTASPIYMKNDIEYEQEQEQEITHELNEEEELIDNMVDLTTEEWDEIGKRAHKFQDMVLYHKDFKSKLDSLITKALDILTEEEAMTGRDLTLKLGLDISKKAHQLAINVVYESLLPYIVEDE